ncbi:MAG: flagellin [Planctomycetes bacterium]|nr:flagellin [Planctomycetota bacterium]
MSRIGSTTAGVDRAIQNNLLRAFNKLNESNLRLATLRRTNRGSDDPAGLIAYEQLVSELTAVNRAQTNAARAASVVRTAESGLSQVSGLLNTIRDRVLASAGTTSEAEQAANQIEINAALEAINRFSSGAGEELTFLFSPDPGDAVTLTLPDVSTTALGGASGRLSDLAEGGVASIAGGNFARAIDILDEASSQVLDARGRLGAFEKTTIGSSLAVLASTEINLSDAISRIGDVDVAAETSRLVRNQILAKSAIATAGLANQNRRSISSLLDVFG